MKHLLIIQTAIAYAIVLSCVLFAIVKSKPFFESIAKNIMQVLGDLNGYFLQEEERESDG